IHKSPSIEERQEKATALLAVDGMGCPNCVNRVRNSLLLVYGVVSASVELDPGRAEVVFNPRLVQPIHLKHAVTAAGGDGRHEYRAYLIG
ncbi:MAG TPA: heavy metal-associated domain-containing protein, partial [Anaerolineales bacterium]|nr:heavy metal-associated domain-containing protein [Anaerolineales bacterium]